MAGPTPSTTKQQPLLPTPPAGLLTVPLCLAPPTCPPPPQIKDDSWFNDKARGRRTRVTQFHEVITGTTGLVWLGRFAWFVTMLEMVGLCVAQTIAGSSNLWNLNKTLPKR